MANAPQIGPLDFLRDPVLLQRQIDLLYALKNLNIQLVVGQGAQKLEAGASSIVGTPPRLTLPIPLKLAAPVTDSTATAASVSARLNELLALLRASGQLPS